MNADCFHKHLQSLLSASFSGNTMVEYRFRDEDQYIHICMYTQYFLIFQQYGEQHLFDCTASSLTFDEEEVMVFWLFIFFSVWLSPLIPVTGTLNRPVSNNRTSS